MKLVVITLPDIVKNEYRAINMMFEHGLEILHLRKPKANAGDISLLLENINHCFHDRITLHDHFELSGEFGVGGLHLNSRNSYVPDGFCGRLSASCHSLDEAERRKQECSYLFLSPVFDSISKEGYGSNFTQAQLRQAAADGIIDEKVFALGGVGVEQIKILKRYSFGGVAVLGGLWGDFKDSADVYGVLTRFDLLARECRG